MAFDKKYAYYIDRGKLALVEQDTSVDGNWKTI